MLVPSVMVDKSFAWAAIVVLLVVLFVPATATAAEPQVLGVGHALNEKPCVLMVNDNVLFGTAKQRGEYVIVRRDDDSEIQLQRKDVACWAKSIRGLYQYRVDQRYSSSAEVHLETARWCLRYGLLDLATKELRDATRIAPGIAAAERIEQQIASAAERKALSPKLVDPTLPTFDPPQVQLASHTEEPIEPAFDLPTLQTFARHIQPLLMNRCANCHSLDSNRKWRIDVTVTGSRASARMSNANLSATMPFVDTGRPLNSELYVRATDGHAGKNATLGVRVPLATRYLGEWLRRVRVVDQAPPQRSPQSIVPARFENQNTEQELPDNSNIEHAPDQTSGMKRLPTVSNPFDPELFNKRFHGTKE